MNKRQKEVIEHQLTMEKAVLDALEKEYREALKDINLKIQMYLSMPETQSRIYHRQYQETLKKQVEAALEKLHSDEYTTINQYVHDCYTDAFVGAFYDLHGQGVPVIAPIDQNAAIRAVMTDSKLNKPLYASLGVDVNKLKNAVSSEISRGIASGLLYDEIARNIQFRTNAPISRAKTIVRTEGHRIQQASAEDARQVAKSKGANVVKQWDATMDGETRPTHRQLDGQIREVEEQFEIGTKKAMYPGEFGDPAEDCNCRCVALTRSRSALDEDELKTLQERAKFFGLDKTNDFEGFKKNYLKATETESKKQAKIESIRSKEIWKGIPNGKRDKIVDALQNGDEDLVEMIDQCMDKCHVTWDIDNDGTSHYTFGSGQITMQKAKDDDDLAQTFWHEYGHFLDDADISGTGIKFVEKTTRRNGQIDEWVMHGTTVVAEKTGYEKAMVKDISKLLDDLGLSNDYYVRVPESEYEHPWLYRKNNDSPLDTTADYDDMYKLRKALTTKFQDISGKTKADRYLYDLGYPTEVNYDDYYEMYVTPKRKTLKTRPKYKGADKAYQNALVARDEAIEEFVSSHDMNAIREEQSRLQEEACKRLAKLGWVSDTIDGSVYGAFQTVVDLGGHKAEYYINGDKGIVESVANVFLANATGDKDMLNAFEMLCPEMFGVLTGAWKHGR